MSELVVDTAAATAAPARSGAFSATELQRVGVAATMIVVGGTLIIVAITMLLGHYSTLSHAGPKAVLDGAVVAMLIGRRGRWRCLALLGTVYGFVLLLQVGVFYLLPVMVMAGLVAAGIGRSLSWVNRGVALGAAAAGYELLCGFGAPVQIYFGTGGSREPIIWGLWFAEWPLRIGGAIVGVWLASRWMRRRESMPQAPVVTSAPLDRIDRSGVKHPQTRNWRQAGRRVALCGVASTLPLAIDSSRLLVAIAVSFIVYALLLAPPRRVLAAVGGICWGWVMFGVMSYCWHHDWHRVADLGRTLVLRFLPLTMASLVLVSTVRPVDLVRLLRRLRLSTAILIPLATVARNVGRSRQVTRQSFAVLKQQGLWRGPGSLVRRPVAVTGALLGGQWRVWSDQLIETDGEGPRNSA